MEKRLIIENFGPVKNAEIEIKKYNIFVGHQSSGKSVIAKLVAIFNDFTQMLLPPKDEDRYLKNQLKEYNINFEIKKETYIMYNDNTFSITLRNGVFDARFDEDAIGVKKDDLDNDIISFIQKADITTFNKLINRTKFNNDSIYIPAERSYFTLLKENIFTLLDTKSSLSIPRCITRFGSFYEELRQSTPNIKIDFMGIEVSFSDNGDKLIISKEKKSIKLSMGSSGVQSVVPLLLVFNGIIEDIQKNNLFIIEEPELNLFPDAQIDLMCNIISKIERSNNSNNSIIITTHSPYIISAIDNLIMAGSVISGNPNSKSQVLKIMENIGNPIKFEDVSSYFFNKNGEVTYISDKENKLLGAECLDKASEYTSNIFDQLLKFM